MHATAPACIRIRARGEPAAQTSASSDREILPNSREEVTDEKYGEHHVIDRPRCHIHYWPRPDGNGSLRDLVFQSACRVRGSPLRCRVGKGNIERQLAKETLTQPDHQPGAEGWSMPTHASRDVVPSEGTSTGDLTRRRFLTYVVAAPVLTVAASSGMDLIAPSKAHAVVPSPPQPENLADLGDVMVAATKLAQHLLVLEVTSDNRIVFRIPRAEVGQGHHDGIRHGGCR